MKPMLPTLTFDLTPKPDWLYEVKYDGFRAILNWDDRGITLTSRNDKPLLPQFPEIAQYLESLEEKFQPFLPLRLDGELVWLENAYKASFSTIQVRGRLKAAKKIAEQAAKSPCRLMVFDILVLAGKSQISKTFEKRKDELLKLFMKL